MQEPPSSIIIKFSEHIYVEELAARKLDKKLTSQIDPKSADITEEEWTNQKTLSEPIRRNWKNQSEDTEKGFGPMRRPTLILLQ